MSQMRSREDLALRALREWWGDAGVEDAPPAADTAVKKPSRPPAEHKPAARPPARPDTAGRNSAPAGETYVSRPQVDAVAEAEKAARAATSLSELAAAIEGYDHCDLKKGARNMVFGDGAPSADVMIVGEAPGRDEDAVGRPFVGPSGQLLDRMFAAIGLSRSANLYIANTLPWRPPGNRNPESEEIAMCLPFLIRHIELVAPRILILTGRVALSTLVPDETSLAPARGRLLTLTAQGAPALPAIAMYHPAYLLRRPIEKAKAWEDLLRLKRWLKEHGLAPSAEPPSPTGGKD
jgi:uracil-DNA glycosylase